MVSYIGASISYSLASIYQQNSDAVSKTLMRLTSGKNFQGPIDDAVGYFRSKAFDAKASVYTDVKTNLDEWSGALDVASAAADEIKSNLDRMQELIYMASESAATADDKANYQNEFNNLALSNQSLVNNTYYQKKALLNTAGALATITINPDDAAPGTISISPGIAVAAAVLTDLANSGADNLTDLPAGALAAAQVDVTAAQTSIASFIGSIAGSRSVLTSQSNVTDSIITNAESASSLISDTDQAQALTTYTAQDIQKQAALAMIAQSNQSSRSVLMLFGLHSG